MPSPYNYDLSNQFERSRLVTNVNRLGHNERWNWLRTWRAELRKTRHGRAVLQGLH